MEGGQVRAKLLLIITENAVIVKLSFDSRTFPAAGRFQAKLKLSLIFIPVLCYIFMENFYIGAEI
jgi:hypothetical protein